MNSKQNLWRGFVAAALVGIVVACTPALATRLPGDMPKAATAALNGKVRLDGSIETSDGHLYLLLAPSTKDKEKESKKAPKSIEVESVIPANAKHPDAVFYSNGWAHVAVLKKGEASTLAIGKDFSEKAKKRLLGLRFPYDMIVPQGFVLAKSLKPLIADVQSITLVDDESINSPEFGQKLKTASKAAYKGAGSIFLTSITSGSITLIDPKTLNKVAEFPTEGTPCSMDLVNGQLYIADQAKNRLLLLDPTKRKFAGQIDLPPHSAPKGIAAPPNAKWAYISESGANDIAVIELATGKVLLRTKVHPGPGRIALTPDGTFLLVLNVTSGEVSIISTYNHKVVSVVKVGDMPTALVVSPDGKMAYIANRTSNTVSVLDVPMHRVVGTIKSGPKPSGVALASDGSKLYVATGADNAITEYDTRSLAKLRELKLPTELEFPGMLCLLPDGRHFLVTSQGANSLALIDAEKLQLEKSTEIGHASHEAVWEPVP